MDTATRVQILDETDCISHSTNALRKGMNPIILPQLWVNSRTDWVLQPWWGNYSRRRKNSEFKPVELRLKIDLVSYPARAEGLVNRIGWWSFSGLYTSFPATTLMSLCLESMLLSGSGTGTSGPWGIGLMAEGTSGYCTWCLFLQFITFRFIMPK